MMMNLIEKLKEQGWYLTEEGLKKLTTINNLQTEDVHKIISAAINWDFKDIAGGALPPKPDSNGTIPGHVVLQIQKMRNISAPRFNEESTSAHRFLQLELSDGVNTISALELERIANLNLNVPPGTKLFIKSEKVKLINSFVVLKSSDIQILGGKVEPLVEKWELARQMLKYARSNRRLSGSGGPPPWIAFGKRTDVHKDALATDKNFKSLQPSNEKDKNSKENDEFNASRSQAIADAAKGGQKKIFGGGQQNILDHNVKKILEKGYSEDEAKQALKTTNNNLERALYNLKRRNNRTGLSENITKPLFVSSGRMRDKGGLSSANEEASSAKPQTNVSLFDFLTDKLPATISSLTSPQTEQVNNNAANGRNSKYTNSTKANNTKTSNAEYNRFENNMSSSFAANRGSISTRSEDRQGSQPRSNNFIRKQDETHQHADSKNGKDVERNNSSTAKNQLHNYNKTQNSVPAVCTVNSKRNERALKKERDQTHKMSNSDHQANKRSNDYNKINEKKSYQSREVNRHPEMKANATNSHQKQMLESDIFAEALVKLEDSASKLSIRNKKDIRSSNQQSKDGKLQQSSSIYNNKKLTGLLQKADHYSNSSQHSSKFTDRQNSATKSFKQNAKVDAQLGNGFAYDPTKIIGFQSKEANEYAMNMLKSQGKTMQQLQASAPQPHQRKPLLPQPTQHHPQATVHKNQTDVTYITHNANIFVTPHQQIPPQFGISGENWPWKNGDLCLAKYWDDGNYYNAKITAISENTCVVLFLGYGNHEEVLKSDCVPTTDSQHIPINAYQTNITAPSALQPSPPPIVQQRSTMYSGIGSVGNQRYRGERQMYIPPPKRNNN